jgi:D-alanyl-D-alanine carboxypeptidase
MMPNERGERARAARVVAVAVVGLVLVLLVALTWGPLSAGSATGQPPGSLPVAAVSSSPGPAVSPAPQSSQGPGPSPSSPAPSSTAQPSPTPPAPSASPSPALVASRLQRTLDRVRAQLSIPGVSVAVLWDDGRSWVGASGLRDIATSDPMTTDTGFALASISKTFTAAVVLQLVEEGKLSLDQSVAPLLPQFKLDARITVRMLLDHTSGLPDFFLGKGIDAALLANPNASWTALQAWAYVPKKHAVPGKTWLYSNTNYLLLGELVSTITGHALAQEVRTRLLDPLGLTTAYFQAVEAPKESGTTAYALVPLANGKYRAKPVLVGSTVMPFRSVVTAAGGAGSIAATALDAARWMRAWAGGDVLNSDMQAQMLADVARTVKLHARIPYGLGIQRVTLAGHTAYGHSGRYIGIRNVVRYIPDLGITIAVLTNQSVVDPTRIATALLKVVVPAPAPPVASPGPSGGPSPSVTPAPS